MTTKDVGKFLGTNISSLVREAGVPFVLMVMFLGSLMAAGWYVSETFLKPLSGAHMEYLREQTSAMREIKDTSRGQLKELEALTESDRHKLESILAQEKAMEELVEVTKESADEMKMQHMTIQGTLNSMQLDIRASKANKVE